MSDKAKTFSRVRIVELVKKYKNKVDTTNEYIKLVNGNVSEIEYARLRFELEVYKDLCFSFGVSPDELE